MTCSMHMAITVTATVRCGAQYAYAYACGLVRTWKIGGRASGVGGMEVGRTEWEVGGRT